ncbi:MAG: phospholipase D-like domain-containing protein [Deltaproteobacteria bacterium]|nr:phospholipase D-like domain-containing protein [Deltaproteobacteria bacterium]
MKTRKIIAALAILCCMVTHNVTWAETRVYFSPPLAGEQKAAAYIIAALDAAESEILVQQYQITEPGIIGALSAAQGRGVKVTALLDKGEHQGAAALSAGGIPVYFDPRRIAHNKVLIIDKKLVICGSFNLTKSANLKNIENCCFMDDAAVVQRFLWNFQRRLRVAQKVSSEP